MSVIIRLQNLPWSANALDIRQYFHGLSIPEGGVHIVGGEQGDAFIAFSTDEDARQAMMADGGKIKEVKLKLFLSSRAEMQKVIEMARQQTIALQDFMQTPQQQATPPLPQVQAPPHPQHPAHLLGAAAGVLSQLHLQQAASQLGLHHHLPPQQPQQPPIIQQPTFPEKNAPGPPEKKENERSRGDNRRNRSRTRSRERDSSHRRNSRDKDRDRYRRRGGRSRSRSRDRRRRDRSRDRSKSRDRGRDRGRRSDKDNGKDNSKDNKDKTNVNDIVVVGQFQGRSNSKLQPGSSTVGQREQKVTAPRINGSLPQDVSAAPPAVNWLSTSAIATASDNSNTPVLPAQPSLRPGNNALLQNPNTPPSVANNRIPNNFPPEEVRGFPAPIGPDQQGWMPPRQPGMYPQRMYGEDGPPQGRGGFRGGPPGRPGRSTRFEPMDGRGGPPEFPPADGPFPHPRGRGDRFQPYDDNFRGGHRPFNNRENPPRRLAPHTCIEIRNMPSTATYRDIRDFFQGMHVFNIKIINDDQGRRTGVSYVRFMNIENKEAALSMNGMSMHGVPIEMSHLDDNIYEEAVDAFTPNNDAIVVALHGLPRYANEQDIRRLFPGARLLDIIVQQSTNPHAPQAFVHFSTVHEGKRALGASGKLTVDGKEIFVERSNIDILLNAKKMMQEVGQDGQSADEEVKEKIVPTRRDATPISSDCVLLQGLPSNANDREILDFFSDVGLVPLRIHVMLDGASTPSGDAFCEFSSCAEGARAMAKNKSMLGTNEVAVRVVARREMEDALGILEQKRHEDKITVPRPNGPVGPMPGPRNGPMPPEHVRGGHMAGPMRGGHVQRGEFRGRGRGHFEMRGGPYMRGGHRGGPSHGHHGGPPMMNRPPLAPEGHARESPTVDNFGKPGCVIELQNVPYKAEIEEIIDYFEGFDVTRPNVIRRYNDGGMPTGDARVALRSPQEAQRAIQELKFKQMRDRQVYLNII